MKTDRPAERLQAIIGIAQSLRQGAHEELGACKAEGKADGYAAGFAAGIMDCCDMLLSDNEAAQAMDDLLADRCGK